MPASPRNTPAVVVDASQITDVLTALVNRLQEQSAQAQAQAQAWAAARQHMNQSRNQDFRPHQQHQLSPHLQHVGSADSSRRESLAMMDPHGMNQNNMSAMGSSMMSGGMDSLDSRQDQFLHMDMGMSTGFVGSNDPSVTMG